MTASVAAAFFASGGLNAGTPVAMASVPVRATAPEANARNEHEHQGDRRQVADAVGQWADTARPDPGR